MNNLLAVELLKLVINYSSKHQLKTLISQNSYSAFIYPTETFLALGCAIDNTSSIDLITELKQRPQQKAYPLVCFDFHMIEKYVSKLPAEAVATLKKLMSYGVSIVFPSQHNSVKLINNIDNSIAFRIIKTKVATALLNIVNSPLIATSANLSGEKPVQRIKNLNRKLLNNKNLLIIEDESILPQYNQASTILKFIPPSKLRLLRNGYFDYKLAKKLLPEHWSFDLA